MPVEYFNFTVFHDSPFSFNFFNPFDHKGKTFTTQIMSQPTH